MKTLPKSLHTVTVLVRCARKYMECERYPAREAVQKVLEDLGYPGYPASEDSYGLAAAAVAQLEAKRSFDL